MMSTTQIVRPDSERLHLLSPTTYRWQFRKEGDRIFEFFLLPALRTYDIRRSSRTAGVLADLLNQAARAAIANHLNLSPLYVSNASAFAKRNPAKIRISPASPIVPVASCLAIIICYRFPQQKQAH